MKSSHKQAGVFGFRRTACRVVVGGAKAVLDTDEETSLAHSLKEHGGQQLEIWAALQKFEDKGSSWLSYSYNSAIQLGSPGSLLPYQNLCGWVERFVSVLLSGDCDLHSQGAVS
jgi:hypothetical protein